MADLDLAERRRYLARLIELGHAVIDLPIDDVLEIVDRAAKAEALAKTYEESAENYRLMLRAATERAEKAERERDEARLRIDAMLLLGDAADTAMADLRALCRAVVERSVEAERERDAARADAARIVPSEAVVEHIKRACRSLGEINHHTIAWLARLDAGRSAAPKGDDMRTCEFCGCRTNARMRACCDEGRAADKARSGAGKGGE